MEGAEAQEKVWLFKHPEVELAVPEVLVPDLDGTGSEIFFSLLYMACGIVVFSCLFFMMDLNGLSDLAPISSPSGEPAEK
jgi:hypothetical protein